MSTDAGSAVPGDTGGTPSYPAHFALHAPLEVANWRPLVHWLLAVPHWIVQYALGVVSQVVAIISWFAILFTGRLPEGLAGLQVLYLRYTARVLTYAGFLREDYPPFTFATTPTDPGDDPAVRLDVRPALDGRNRATTFFRLVLAIPHLVVLAVLGIAVWFVSVIGFFAVLFTGRWPQGLRDFLVGYGRWYTRAAAYYLLLTDEYPPFTLE